MATRSPYAFIAAAALASLLVSARAGAATPFELRPIGSFSAPVEVAVPLHEDHALYVVELGGRVRVVLDGTILPQPFLDVSALVSATGEGGLLSIAFAPRYRDTGRVVVVYVDRATGSLQISEYRRSTSDPLVADPLSARPILTIPHPTFTNHYGGSSAFGPDGLLYLGTGDGGGGGDTQGNAQNLGSLLGKLLRIDPFGGDPYAIPAGNPFVATPGARPEIFAYGLRNPWRFSFDRATGDLTIGDVGQAVREEIDFVRAPVPAGLNFGWNVYEGSRVFGPGSAPNAVFPVFEYEHDGVVCSITGGVVVRDPALAALEGRYVYGDWCGGELRSLALGVPLASDDVDMGLKVPQVVSLDQDAGGCVYAVSIGGTVYRLAAVGSAAPVPCTDVPPETTVSSASGPQSFVFSSSEAGSTFECSVDGGAWDTCSSPKAYGLPPGDHAFEVRATDPGGSIDPTPAQASFSVPAPPAQPVPAPPAAPVKARVDIAVSLAASPQPAHVGTTLTFVAAVANRGAAASAATVTFTLAAGMGYEGGDPGCSASGASVTCRLDVSAGSVSQARIRVLLRAAGTLTASVAVSSDPADADPSDNAAPLTLRVAGSAIGRTLLGTATSDSLVGTPRDDVLRGLGGNDRLDGRGGRDRLYGGGGDDTITGGSGADAVFGGPGRDSVYVRGDGRDSVSCGGGRDTVFAGRTDKVARDCELVRRG